MSKTNKNTHTSFSKTLLPNALKYIKDVEKRHHKNMIKQICLVFHSYCGVH